MTSEENPSRFLMTQERIDAYMADWERQKEAQAAEVRAQREAGAALEAHRTAGPTEEMLDSPAEEFARKRAQAAAGELPAGWRVEGSTVYEPAALEEPASAPAVVETVALEQEIAPEHGGEIDEAAAQASAVAQDAKGTHFIAGGDSLSALIKTYYPEPGIPDNAFGYLMLKTAIEQANPALAATLFYALPDGGYGFSPDSAANVAIVLPGADAVRGAFHNAGVTYTQAAGEIRDAYDLAPNAPLLAQEKLESAGVRFG